MSNSSKSNIDASGAQECPKGDFAGFRKYLKSDLAAGFLVFLIALPLCLGISLACGFPAIAGIFTAIIGAIGSTFISNSELTIKGPAAGLIVIAIGAIEAFGGDGAIGGFTAGDMSAYRMALAVGVVAAGLQIGFGLLRAGILGEFFPLAAVHGMLAAIGVIIMIKQIPVALGVTGKGEPLEMLREMPHYFKEMNPEIALIGGICILIMFCWPIFQKKFKFCKPIPAAMIALAVAIPMGMMFDLIHDHTYSFLGHKYEVGEAYLVRMPDRPFGMFDFITTPDFSAFSGEHLSTAIKYSLLFFIIGSLESLLSAKAVDVLDPWKRKTNMDRDILAVGVCNMGSAFVGGLPMISEIVRSKSNIDNGARTRFADFWHGIFLLLCVALIPTYLHRIPLAALAAMLIFTGFRLTHPSEFRKVYHIGREQLLIFFATLIGVLATDLLIGIVIGIVVKVIVHWMNGADLLTLHKFHHEMSVKGDTVIFEVEKSLVFANWIAFRKALTRHGIEEKKNVMVDFSKTTLIDHSTMEKLHEVESEFKAAGLKLELQGMDRFLALSDHPLAARRSS